VSGKNEREQDITDKTRIKSYYNMFNFCFVNISLQFLVFKIICTNRLVLSWKSPF